jgi:nicotinamidase-related amidase
MTALPSADPEDKTLLLCIDMQPAFLAAIPQSQHTHWRCSFALEAARGLGVPVLFTEQVPEKLGKTAADLLALAAEPLVFAKDSFSALSEERFRTHLVGTQAKHLVLCGIETPVCVYQTAFQAMGLGYRVTILADCVGARRSDDASTALASLVHSGCTVVPAETFFYALLGNARHPFFRSYTALVKKYG